MLDRAPISLRHGPLTVYLRSLEGCPDLGRVLAALPPDGPVVWLDSARPHPVTGRWSLLGYDPWLTLTARGGRVEVRTSSATHIRRAHPLEVLREILRRYRAPACHVPHARAVGLLGFLSYDVNRWIEHLPAPQSTEDPVPELLWFGMRVVILVDHDAQRTWLVSIADPHGAPALARREALEALEAAEARLRLETAQPDNGPDSAHPTAVTLEPTTTQAEFESMVRRALEHIRAGDIFQANVSQRFCATWREPSRGSGDGRGRPALQLYQRLRRINPSPFACFLAWEDLAVVSCSPERLVRVQEGRIDARPIAGTRPRGATPVEDAINSLDLLLSEKERAEHVMLVDLARNDLGRLCRMGSVAVEELMTLEDYSHVIHIVSEVSGWLRRGVDAVDVIRAVFPGGTITGCPKVRCMQILRELEPVARGLYTGSLGYLGFDGALDLNIAIRTMILRGDRVSFHVGAGIVADSDPTREYHETLAKAAALVSALGAVPTPAADASAR